MKTKILFAALAAAAMFTGCKKNVDVEGRIQATPSGSERLEVTVSNSFSKAAGTKAAGAASESDEKNLKSAAVYVFADDGKIEASGTTTSATLNMNCTKGHKTVAVVVNATVSGAVATLTELKAKVVSLTDNASDALVMFGTEDVDVDGNTSVTVTAERLVSKIVIEKISNRMTLPQYQSQPVAVKGVYLINVAGDVCLNGTYAPTLWLNKSRNEASADNLYYEKPSALNIAYNSSDEAAHHFYCCPNPTLADNADDEWSARHTRLVVEAEVGGKVCYYPVTLPVLKGNTVYTIGELTITRPGVDKPDMESALGSLTFTIEVAPWNEESVESVTI